MGLVSQKEEELYQALKNGELKKADDSKNEIVQANKQKEYEKREKKRKEFEAVDVTGIDMITIKKSHFRTQKVAIPNQHKDQLKILVTLDEASKMGFSDKYILAQQRLKALGIAQ